MIVYPFLKSEMKNVKTYKHYATMHRSAKTNLNIVKKLTSKEVIIYAFIENSYQVQVAPVLNFLTRALFCAISKPELYRSRSIISNALFINKQNVQLSQ